MIITNVARIALVVAGALAARRIQARLATVEQHLQQKIEPLVDQVQPLVERLNVISADATRLSALAVQQAEKADVALTSAARRVDQTLAVVQNAVVAPARETTTSASA